MTAEAGTGERSTVVRELVLAPTDRTRATSGGDAYASRVSFLERLVGEASRSEEGLRSASVLWLGGPRRDPAVTLIGGVTAADAESASAAGRALEADLAGALLDHSPVAWLPASARLRREMAHGLGLPLVARLSLGSAGDPAATVEIYPLRATTIERALRRVRDPTLVRFDLLVTPRRRVVPLRPASTSQGFGRLVTPGATMREDAPQVRRADAAERWQFLVRVEIRAAGDPPTDLMGAIAGELRGLGQRSVGIVISGTAAAVDAEWRVVRDADASGNALHDDRAWPADTVRLNLREAACLLPLPAGEEADEPPAQRLARVPSRLPRRGLVLGSVGGRRPAAIDTGDFLRHLFLIGATGSGKSTCLLNLIDQVARDPVQPALFVLDPHGSLVEQVMGTRQPDDIGRVVLFDPSDAAAPMTWNPLAVASEAEQRAVVDAFTSWAWEMFDPRRTMQAGMGKIAEQTLRSVLMTVLAKPGSTLVDAYDLIQDDDHADAYLPFLTDPPTRAFWDMRAAMSPKDKTEYANYLTSIFSPFVHDQAMRAVVAHERSTLDLREAIGAGRIVLVPLRKAVLGTETTTALMRLFKRFLWREIAFRGAGPDRRRVVVVIDEFTNYASELDEVMLAEARKFSTSVVLATQNLGQARDSLVESVAANAASMLAYRVGLHDSSTVAAMLGESSIAPELTRLPNFKAVARLPVGGEPLPPVLIDSPKPLRSFSAARVAEVREASRTLYGVMRAENRVAAVEPDTDGHDASGAPSEGNAEMADVGYLESPVTGAAIHDLLTAAYIDAELDADGDVVATGPYRCWVKPGKRDIRLMSGFGARSGKPLNLQLAYANRVNDALKLPRVSLHANDDGSHSFIMDWYLPASAPISKREFVTSLGRFLSAIEDAIAADTDDVIA